ncbi:MFS transporter [Flavobacteriaceae bacterium M23B6Z8]
MKKFYLYLSLLMVSLFGTDLTDFTLAIWILDQPNAAVSSYTLTWFFEAAPAVLLSVFIGGFVDRWDKRKMIIFGQLAAGIGSVSLLMLYNSNTLVPWHIMLVAGLGSISSMFVFQSFFVATKSLVPAKDLVRAQAMVSMGYGMLQMSVPIIAPIFYKLIGPTNVFLIDIITFTISIFGFLILGKIIVAQENEPFNIMNDLRLVKKFIFDKIGFLYLLPFSFLSQFFLALIMVLFTPWILDFADEYTLGIISACFGVGSIIGSSIMSIRKSKKYTSPGKKVITIHAIIGFLIMGFAVYVNPFFIGFLGIVIAIFFSMGEPIYNSIILTLVPEKMMGRFSGVIGLFVGVAAPLAFLISGFLVDILNSSFENTRFVDYYPGTVITVSIVALFALMGLLLLSLSLAFRNLKGIKILDGLYEKEIDKSIQMAEEEKLLEEAEKSEETVNV